jgi:lipopolysaccharide export system protein LptC
MCREFDGGWPLWRAIRYGKIRTLGDKEPSLAKTWWMADLRMTDLTRAPGASHGRDLPVAKSRRAIRIARLHSIFVRYIRHFIVVGCGGAILALGIIVFFDPFKRIPRNLSVSSVGLRGSVVTLEAPKMKGVRQDGQPFELKGLSGTQDILKPNVVSIVGVDAKIGMDDTTTTSVTAGTGVYDSSQDVVWLRNDVRIRNGGGGYDMRMRSAQMDLNSGELRTEEPVIVLLDGTSTVTADRMRISEYGHKVSFEGGIKSTIEDTDVGDGNSSAQVAK